MVPLQDCRTGRRIGAPKNESGCDLSCNSSSPVTRISLQQAPRCSPCTVLRQANKLQSRQSSCPFGQSWLVSQQNLQMEEFVGSWFGIGIAVGAVIGALLVLATQWVFTSCYSQRSFSKVTCLCRRLWQRLQGTPQQTIRLQ
jgi:hypothetical protein